MVAAFTPKLRLSLASKGEAMSGKGGGVRGSFPIRNQADLENAIRAIGRASDPASTKAFVIRRARELGLLKVVPTSWL